MAQSCGVQVVHNIAYHIQRGSKPGLVLLGWRQERIWIPGVICGLGGEERIALNREVVCQVENIPGSGASTVEEDQCAFSCFRFGSLCCYLLRMHEVMNYRVSRGRRRHPDLS